MTTTEQLFPDHTVESAPAAARPTLENLQRRFGGSLPPAVARLAESPDLLDVFLSASTVFDRCSLAPLERETLIMTVAVRNGCDVCVQMHSGILRRIGAEPELVTALRSGTTAPAPRLAALQAFTHAVMDCAGAVDDEVMDAFRCQGYTARQALDVVLGIGTYTLSTLANRMTKAPIAAR